MKLNEYMTSLVETHIDIVKWAIIKHIKVNEGVVGLGYDDLFQEGCAALCKAAVSFDGSVKFVTYAQVVVRNALISYCRGVTHNKNGADISLDEAGDFAYDNTYDDIMSDDANVLELLELLKVEYSGVARLGIEALVLKIKGYTGADIARMYGVKPNLIGAWISRAASKLRQNEHFLAKFGLTASITHNGC